MGMVERCLLVFFTTVALRVFAKVLIRQVDTEAAYSKPNGYVETRDLKNQIKARIHDLHTMSRIW